MDTNKNARKIISLNGEWQFAYTKNTPEEAGELPEKEQYETKLPVPAYWDDCTDILKYTKFWSRGCVFNPEFRHIEFPMGALKPPDASLPYLIGTGWYRKVFKAGEDWDKKFVTLHIGGAMLEAYVYLNGELLMQRRSNGQPFDICLGKNLKYNEENELIIAVTNAKKDRTGCSIRGFKGRSAGISRSVSLEISDGARISDCYIHTTSEMDKLIWEFNVDGNVSDNHKIKWDIYDGNKLIAEGLFSINKDNLKFETDSFNLSQWSDNNPKLYKIKLILLDGWQVVDHMEQNYGFRYIESRGEEIYLNNNPVLLRGLTDHAYFPETCTVTNDVSYYMKTIKALKEIGFNWTRFHTTIPPEEYLEAADMLGMMVQVETQNNFAEEEFYNMLIQCRKHPSVVLYCCGNEVPITAEFEPKLKRMAELCHTLVPDCMYNPMEAMLRVECIFVEEEEGYTETPTPHNKIRLDKLREYSDVFGTAVWVYSYESLESDMKKIDDRLSIYKKPCLVHEAGIFDTYINLDMEKRYEGTRITPELFSAARKYIDEMGLLHNASTYYRNSCKWMMQITKFTLEKARRCKSVAGYDFLGASDCHWHRTGYGIGMLNEFYELKAASTVNGIRQFNGESLILSDVSHKRNFFSGEIMEVELFASLYGGENLDKGILIWSLVDDTDKVYVSGIKELENIENGKVTPIEKLSITAPKLDKGKHMKLKVSLNGGMYSLTNEWDYWVFPEINEVESNGVYIVNELKDRYIDHLHNGGKVILFGSKPFPSLPTTYQIASGGRVDGNTATVVYDHPLMRNFPHDGFCDWQFMPMIEGGNTVQFNDIGTEFNPIVEIVSTYKMIRKQAALFELKVGKGSLLVCTFNLDGEDAGTKTLYNNMIEYALSPDFRPETEIDVKELREMMKNQNDIHVDFSTDECFDAGGHVTEN